MDQIVSQDVREIELSLIVPTFNERENIIPLLERLESALDGISWELIVVDDNSPDGTSNQVREIARRDHRVRAVQRVGRRGLSSAVVEGMLASSASTIGVMDADMQHDEAILPQLWKAVARGECDLAVGSRYVQGGGMGDWDQKRQSISRGATWLANLVLKTHISDPMSGFFVISRRAFEAALPNLSTIGFKILVDLVASAPQPLKVIEVPYEFRARNFGESKLDSAVVWEYLVLLADKLFGHIIPVRFVLFAAVGGLGLFVHLAALGLALKVFGLSFLVAQSIAVLVAMTFNFNVNNFFTYRDRRLTGRGLVYGLLSFYLICLVGAFANVGVGTYIYDANITWWVAGVAGAVVGAVWNYAVSSVFTWRK
ncbi:dolichol monophosphate mannose synthase [Bradyrhizobium lablabi]|uniref:Dolichol monophosphate mannose synthase n=1 Tax=Bradyrhizobium lablabi TaxID=722472 RepID=A0A0R3MAG2_9BRAD|nr:glycosyltransferase family 2 protein [Bradyrhizobium lablabi]KRR16780.1 dolichol monophosphate mannose synthase [Bradyrhizobium lablabi]